jgi:hypothetical protein
VADGDEVAPRLGKGPYGLGNFERICDASSRDMILSVSRTDNDDNVWFMR